MLILSSWAPAGRRLKMCWGECSCLSMDSCPVAPANTPPSQKSTVHEDLEISLPPCENEKHHHSATDKTRFTIPLYSYSAAVYESLNRVLNSIMVTLLPCASIISLNAVPDPNKRVGMICAFSFLCAIGMALCSTATRIEVFAVTAA